SSEDHPQYRYYRLCSDLGVDPVAVPVWHGTPAASAERNRVISLSLRPAPVTDQWMREGGSLPDLTSAMADVTLIEAQSPRAEAVAIALRLREAAERGRRAMLITPDRQLGRQVTAALDRWGIMADDSAGRPLALSPPGRFLRHIAAMRGRRVTADALLTLLKHPLTNSGDGGRGDHLRWTRALELQLRSHGPAFPTGDEVVLWAATRRDEGLADWALWVRDCLARVDGGDMHLAHHLAAHIGLAEAFARGPRPEGAITIWEHEAGIMARAVCDELVGEAEHGGEMSAFDYDALFAAVLQDKPVRETETVHPDILIRGTIEARVTEAELVILGGLNDGIWPPIPAPDSWLNRQLRHQLGLLLPDRQIGLSAHDYQQAVTAREVVLSRAIRDAEAQTVQSRWLNRLMNLLAGLPERQGPAALEQMRERGHHWLRMAEALDLPAAAVDPAPRPSPRPPVAARPRKLAVTGIQKLIRDPYAIYARYILRLKPLDPLHPGPDARLRGSVLHKILERFVNDRQDEDIAAAKARLLTIADRVMAEEIPWATAQRLWRARLARSADDFLALEARRPGTPCLTEGDGALQVSPLDFTLTAKPDRIDMLDDGRLQIFDYKTGPLPTSKQQQVFDKQLLLEAAMAERGAFGALGPCAVDRTIYVSLGGEVKEAVIEITDEVTGKVWEELHRLLAAYARAGQGYTSRRAVERESFGGDYDHLARYGEWDMSDAARPEDVE
ncbi:MAG: double-strand break repair protein AddB, partial [Paracoccaceae bacterium]|nr:double-strand break repair protein AddB [Paracoccaceae bacterium]